MREWQLKSGDPLTLTLANDLRLVRTNYADDLIWELSLGGGEPPALALQSTWGLRARAFRLFPQFILNEIRYTDPATFAESPQVTRTFPNYLHLRFRLLNDLEVEAEFWIPEPQLVAGRFALMNSGASRLTLGLELVAQLTPADGQRMACSREEAPYLLEGQSDGLYPALFLSGGVTPGKGALPSLFTRMELAPDDKRTLVWGLAVTNDPQRSVALAREVPSLKWEAVLARLELLNSGQVEVYCGDPDWDAVFMLSQRQAIHLMLSESEQLPHPSFVISRQPDHGYSLLGDGSDYAYLWNGQSPLEAYYLADLLLPVAPNLAQGLLLNYLAVQEEDGFVDWRPGLAGQRSRLLATPLLASLAWRIYQATEDRGFLEYCFEPLCRFVRLWLSSVHDRDGDGFPEWDHVMQAGDDEHPIYTPWQPWAQGVDITTAERPALAAFLYRECTTLLAMAQILERNDVEELESAAERLKNLVEACWDETAATYVDRDREVHANTRAEVLIEGQGSGIFWVERAFDEAVRLVVNIYTDERVRRYPTLFVHGKSASGKPRVMRIADEDIQWMPGWGHVTAERVFSAVKKVEVAGLDPEDRFVLSTAGYNGQDISHLIPLWAGIPNLERAQKLVQETLMNPLRFWREFGLPSVVYPPAPQAVTANCVNLAWNTLVLEGLLHYGFRDEAAALLQRWMKAIIRTSRSEAAFRRYYHAESGQGYGERNALNGLAPLGSFLAVMGIRIFSPWRVFLEGGNPFPWPVTVKYRGLSVLRQRERSVVIFPDGQTVVVEDSAPRMVSLDAEEAR